MTSERSTPRLMIQRGAGAAPTGAVMGATAAIHRSYKMVVGQTGQTGQTIVFRGLSASLMQGCLNRRRKAFVPPPLPPLLLFRGLRRRLRHRAVITHRLQLVAGLRRQIA